MGQTDFFPQEIIRNKRDGAVLSDTEIEFMVGGLTSGAISESQIGAFAMAVFFNGMNMEERVALTRAMTHSGTVLDWSDAGFDGPVLDKHSTGGIGDKVSLILAPVMAACGAAVPMISGRGLGHSGGTLDKLDSIPGYNTTPDLETLRRTVKRAGCAIIGQTAELAPADGRLYAIRDVTATVESLSLITASILSKKLAAGLDGLVMDVKYGTGAFASAFDEAHSLAESIVSVANGAGLPCAALLTDMNQALGRSAGNALEVQESIDHLSGLKRDARLHEVTMSLAAEILTIGGLSNDIDDGRAKAEHSLSSGQAAEHFTRMVAELGGPADIMARGAKHLPEAKVIFAAAPTRPGVVTAVDARALGIAIMGLGGGRRRAEDDIDYSVGLGEIAAIGERSDTERPLCIVHAATEADAHRAAVEIRAAFTIGDEAPPKAPVVRRRVGPDKPLDQT
ncbi:MAG: thymidine phosphorylase [Rhodospirillaceae bacterium]|nr:thymidine phosphorylase [Rhodospirillaceae bacterium]